MRMKRLYLILILALIAVISMIVFAFYYLDQKRHQISSYGIYIKDELTGYEKIDRYRLENRLIYKSVAEFPRSSENSKIARRISFDARGKGLIDYKKEQMCKGSVFTVLISQFEDKLSFIASGYSDFSFLEDVPTYGNDIIFEKEALVTYPPLIKRYNFKRHDEQFVNVVIPTTNFLPPARNTISIKPIGKDTIEIEDRNVNCERLALKLKNGDFISIWVTKNFHNILMVEIPKDKFKAVYSVKREGIAVKKYKKESILYKEKNITFGNHDITLSGNLTVPAKGNSSYPAVLLIGSDGPTDRDELGMFVDIADELGRNGYCVLRFDKRGIGQSQGFYSASSREEQLSDIRSAINYLKTAVEIDKSRIALLGFAEGGFYATYITGVDKDIRACIILSAVSSLSPIDSNYKKIERMTNKISPHDEYYRNSAIKAIVQSRKIVSDNKNDWMNVMNVRVFIKKILDEKKYNPLEVVKKVKVPLLILHGRQDEVSPIYEPQALSKSLEDMQNKSFTTIYFGDLNHYLGNMIKDPPMEDHNEVNGEVLQSITLWLEANLLPKKALADLIIENVMQAEEISAEKAIEQKEDTEKPDLSNITTF